MSPTPADGSSFPGPSALGRGVVVAPGRDVPAAAVDWPRVVVDRETLQKPGETLAALDRLWRDREPAIVELAVPVGELKAPELCEDPPWMLDPTFTFERERLHFLVWINRYDGRDPDAPPRWPHVRRAVEVGAIPAEAEANASGPAPAAGDILLSDGTPAWIDGGPRAHDAGLGPGEYLVHVNQVWAGDLTPDLAASPNAELAPDQDTAVCHPVGPARVLAPAGSGKTRVLTERLRHLLADRRWAPSSVTALAYNARAAAEMRRRTRDLPGAQVRTLHSLGYEVLGRQRGGRPQVLDERDVRRMLDGLVNVKFKANDDVFAPYLEALAEVRAALRSPALVEEERGDVPGFADMFAEYRARLERQGAIDHDEQIYGAIEALLRDPQLRADLRDRCAHVLLDELQDLTPAQLLLVRLLAAPALDVYGVGDDDQVIYGYAGADPRFLVDYDQYFPGAAAYQLEVNYRCPPAVVEAATKLLVNNRIRVAKETRAASRPEPGEVGEGGAEAGLTVLRPPEDQMGDGLVEAVTRRLAEGAEPDEIAVLARVNAALLAPQVLLGQAGVPVQAPLDERMLDRTGLKAALAWLRLAVAAGDRQMLDGEDLAIAARRPPRKLSRGVVDALGRGAWSLNNLGSFASRIEQKGMRTGMEALHRDVEWMGTLVRARESTARLLTEVRDSVGLGTALDQLDGGRSSPRGGHGDDLDALILVARAQPAVDEFEVWLRQTLRQPSPGRAAGGDRPGDAGPDGATDGTVVLSTVHRVKGLEWPHVVVWDVSDGVMPHHLNRTGAGLEEERRVFHVALTRARESATVVARAGAESPFVAEMAGHRSKPPPEPAAAAAGKGRRGPADGAKADSGVDTSDPVIAARIEALKAWRRERAQADGMPPYIVLYDRHIEDIAARAPTSLDELSRCNGIGPTKLDRYGPDILDVLAAIS